MKVISLVLAIFFIVSPMLANAENVSMCNRPYKHYENGWHPPSQKSIKWDKKEVPGKVLYVHNSYWNNSKVKNQLLQAVKGWNIAQKDADHRIELAGDSQHPLQRNKRYKYKNGYSEIYPTSDLSIGAVGQAAINITHDTVRWLRTGNCRIREADIQMSAKIKPLKTPLYGGDPNSVDNGTERHIGLIAQHEAGHILNHKHYDNVVRRMNTLYPAGGPLGNDYDVSPMGVDLNLVAQHYSVNSVKDLATSSWELRTTSDGLKPISARMWYNNIKTDNIPVNEGSQLPFVVMNRSSKQQLLRVNYYLSSDAKFSNNEKFARDVWRVGPYAHVSGKKWVTPRKTGTYYIGYSVEAISRETSTKNNTVKLWKRIKICNGSSFKYDNKNRTYKCN